MLKKGKVAISLKGVILMECKIESWLWKAVVNAAHYIKPEAVFNFEKKGLRIRCQHEAGFSLIHLEVPASCFKSYEPLGEPIKLACAPILKRLTGLNPANVVTLKVDLKSSSGFKMDLATKFGHSVRGVPIFALEDKDKEPPEVKKFVADAKVKVVASALLSAVKDAELIESLGVWFEGRSNPDRFVVWNTEHGTFNSSWSEFEEPLSLFALEVKGERVKSRYGCYLVKDVLSAGIAFSNVCRVGFAESMPMKISFELPFEGKLEFFVAPIIEKE